MLLQLLTISSVGLISEFLNYAWWYQLSWWELIKLLASSFGAGYDFSCENHEFSSPANSVSLPVTENAILQGQTFQLLERKLNL